MEKNNPSIKKCPYCGEHPRINRSGQMCKCWNHDEFMRFEDWNRRPIEDKLQHQIKELMTALHPIFHKILAMHSDSELAAMDSELAAMGLKCEGLGITLTLDESRNV